MSLLQYIALITRTRVLALIIIIILFCVSTFGIFWAYRMPTEIEETIPTLNYQHEGEFDYIVHLKDSYLYGDIPLDINPVTSNISADPSSYLKYPSSFADRLYFTFDYGLNADLPLTNVSEQFEIKVVMQKPAQAKEEIIAVPLTKTTGVLSANFSLDASELALSPTTTITANVYPTIELDGIGPIFESFNQILIIKSNGPLIEVSEDLTNTQQSTFGNIKYEQNGSFDYYVQLKPDSPFGAISLTSPQSKTSPMAPISESEIILKPGDTIYKKLFDKIDLTFSYKLTADKALRNIENDIQVNAVLENPGVWSKIFPLTPLEQKNGSFTVSFSLDSTDLDYYSNVFSAVTNEIGATVPNDLVIKADVHTVAQTAYGQIDDLFSQTISTNIAGNILELKENDLIYSQPGTITSNAMVPNPDKFMGLSVRQFRITAITVSGISLILLAYLLWLNFWVKHPKPSPAELINKEFIKAKKKNKGVIIDISELPNTETYNTVIKLDSLNDLISTSDNLLKPIFHITEENKHTYLIIDNLTKYEYISEA
ncbi:MAG: DUF5305 family protein [Dehalococcoidales bacterium]|nr:DUF5305 family protein [Dehalococcoidales bacterium]